jgi:5-methylcytosine-specific restriction endonuclease McrA
MVQRIKAATRDGVVYCDLCGLPAKKWEIDHIKADAMHLEEDKDASNTFENSRLLCIACHKEKTKTDVKDIARAKRREAKHLGVKNTKQKIVSRGFAKKEKKEKLPLPPRRGYYE